MVSTAGRDETVIRESIRDRAGREAVGPIEPVEVISHRSGGSGSTGAA
jgi:hypothetical protein